jgi:hypothetical protein
VKCRHCSAELDRTLPDLGSEPPSNAYLAAAGFGRLLKPHAVATFEFPQPLRMNELCQFVPCVVDRQPVPRLELW